MFWQTMLAIARQSAADICSKDSTRNVLCCRRTSHNMSTFPLCARLHCCTWSHRRTHTASKALGSEDNLWKEVSDERECLEFVQHTCAVEVGDTSRKFAKMRAQDGSRLLNVS